MKIAVGGPHSDIVATKTQQPRNSEGCGEGQKFLFPQPCFVQIVHFLRKTLFLFGMGSIYQNHAGHLAAIEAGKQADVVSAHGVAGENIRRRDPGIVQKHVQLFGHVFACSRARAGLAVAKPGTVVRTHSRKLGDLRLHFAPRNVAIAQAGVKNHHRSSLAAAVNMHFEAANINELPGHGIKTAVAGLRNVLVKKSRNREQDNENEQSSNDDTEPRAAWRGRVGGR